MHDVTRQNVLGGQCCFGAARNGGALKWGKEGLKSDDRDSCLLWNNIDNYIMENLPWN